MATRGVQSKLIRFYLKSELFLFVLAVLTIIAIPLKSMFTFEKEVDIFFERADFVDDAAQGGLSRGEFLSEDKSTFVCHLKKSSYLHPYCGLHLPLSGSLEKGIDMSNYDSLTLDIDYSGDASSLRFYVRNYNPVYSKPGDITTAKYHIVEFERNLLREKFDVKLQFFTVADWWIARNKIPFAQSQTELDNVSYMQIQTGAKSPLGDHTFKINGIYLKRQLISNEKFYLALVVIWVTTILAFLAFRLYIQNVEILRQRFNAKVLQKEKEVLDRIAENLERESKTDKLTGVLNRSGMDDHISTAFREFNDFETLFSYIIFDIDFFKQVNDEHGHDVGDQILVDISRLVSENIRMKDCFGRWGGEEFVILCNDTDVNSAERMADKLREKVEHHTFANNMKITCSFGVACVAPGVTADALFKMADEALYEAKRSGRNKVCAKR